MTLELFLMVVSNDRASSSTETFEINMSFEYVLYAYFLWIITKGLLYISHIDLKCVSALHHFLLVMSVIHSTCRNYMKGLKVLKKDKRCCQVVFCFVFQVFGIVQFHRPWFISNDILLQILKWWDFVEFFWNCEFWNKYWIFW